MAVNNRLKNQHLLWRAAFGPMAEVVADLDGMPQKKLWKTLLDTSADAPKPIAIATNPFEDKTYMNPDGTMMARENFTAEQRKLMNKQWRQELKDMNLAWLSLMINSKAQLREKLSLFWHGHFACRVNNSYFSQQLLNTIRANALGNFGDLLMAVSKSPAMLQYLNNQQNKKGKPNENFAREVMELFTMGRGNYTETDVKEGARSFTGWTFDKTGQFAFKENVHDTDSKTFLGETSNFNGDDVLNIILKKQQTAYFITKKIYKYFVNENVDEAKVQALSARFYKNNYNITKLLDDIFTSDWFFTAQNIGVKIKSPVELIVGIRRFLPLALDNDDAQILYQKVLGQELFYPPNVAGWPGGKNWIDSSTLMVRLQIPQVFSAKDAIDIRPKTDDDMNMGLSEEKRLKLGKNAAFSTTGGNATINWQMVNSIFEKTARPQLSQAIITSLLQTNGSIDVAVLSKYVNNESRDAFIKSVVINTMSTPEYQLC